jgi:serine protease Do
MVLAATATAQPAESLMAQEEVALRAAAEAVAPSVVQIRTIGGLDEVGGTLLAEGPTTGLVISADGYILSSAFNFVQQPASILVTLPSGKQAPAELVATDHSRMLVLLKISGVADLPAPTLAPAEEIRPGQWAVAVGRTFRADRVNISVGIVSAVGRMFGKAIQTDADVSTACYGGPLVDVRGRVLGLIVPMAPQGSSEVAGAEWYDSGIGFAVPLAPLADAIERMKKGEDQRPGLLGIGMEAKNPHSSPAELAAVRPDSPAGKVGLKKGDRIIELDGKSVKTQTDLRFALGPRYSGESLNVVAMRGDERLERTIELVGKLPPFRHAFLGILAMRPTLPESDEDAEEVDADKANIEDNEKPPAQSGIVVRTVYAGSPAEEAGIRAGDRIERIEDSNIKSIAGAIEAMNNLAPGHELKLTLVRDDETKDMTLMTARMPTSVPAELPLAYSIADDSDEGTVAPEKASESRDLKLPEFPNKCKVYVPSSSSLERSLAVLLWLQVPGKSSSDDVIRDWKSICDRDGVLLVVPSSADKNRWERMELEYLLRLTVRVIADYKVDPRRIVVYGEDGGGAMAWHIGLSGRNVFRGIATSSTRFPRQLAVPPNEPAQRLAIFAAVPSKKDSADQIMPGLRKLSDAGYPVTTVSTGEASGQLNDEQREEFARWVDTLDRF